MNEAEAPPAWEQPLDELRADFNEFVISLQKPGSQLKRVENRDIPGPHGPIPVRIYWPGDAPDGPLPILVHFHGSGFVVLGLDSHDNSCRELCVGTSCIVVAVNYRKAPENTFPNQQTMPGLRPNGRRTIAPSWVVTRTVWRYAAIRPVAVWLPSSPNAHAVRMA